MKDIRFNSLIQVVDFFCDTKLKVLGSGAEGTCYKVGNKTYKLYNDIYSDLFNNEVDKMNLLKFRDIIINNVYFIRALIYYENDLIGIITDYASGINCGKTLLYRRNLDKLILALNTLSDNIYELSKLGIYIEDHFLPNILYDNVNFKLIDTGSYYYSKEIPESDDNKDKDDIEVIYKKNMTKIMKMLFSSITNVDPLRDNFIFAFLWYIDSPYKKYLVDTDLLLNPGDTITGIRNTIQEEIGREITAFSQCKNDLLRIRKKR